MTVEIGPERRLLDLRLAEVWQSRELFFFLTWRDVKVRYKQAALGVAWAVLQPIALMVVFSIFLGHLAGIPSDGTPYPVFVLTGLVPWTLFSSSLTSASNSLVESRHVITKVYFPRLLLPLSASTSYLLDFMISVVVLLVLIWIYGLGFSIGLIWLPALTLLAFTVAAAFGTLFAAINARFRDVRYALPLLIQAWLFLTPVAYPASLIPSQCESLYWLNPMVGVVEGFRWALLGTGTLNQGALAISLASCLGTAILALVVFQRMDRTVADVV